MAVGEIFLAAFLQLLLDRLTPQEILNKFGLLRGVDKKLKKWSATLSAIGAVLYDAEEKQLTSKSVELWLDDLRSLAYDVEDILDKLSTEMLRRKVQGKNHASTCKVRRLIPKVKFHFSMNSEIKQITDQLKEISERKDLLGLHYVGTTSTNAWKRSPSSCVLSGAPVVGRDDDKAKIIEFLSRDEPSTVHFHVVAIVGMPGVGKTTLAQFIFNDNCDALKQFNLKVWVSVSDDFNLVRVSKAILESVTCQCCDLKEFSNIQNSLCKELAGKKFLIVLDDVWNTCDYDLWTTLQSPFRVGAPGSKIIVTTRDGEVTKTIRAFEVHNLEYISDDDCWKVFEQHAFLNINISRRPKFELLKEKIVAKCGGLPLAARTLGGLLGCKKVDEWEEILNNRLWILSDQGNILPILNLSYHYLPSNLKRCFAYCSILPNDYEFGERQLILLWIAEGLIPLPEENKQLEDLGGDYFQELLSRSLFQNSSRNSSLYVMHDLVSDLARRVAGEICFRLEDVLDSNMQSRCSPRARHSSYIPSAYDGVKKFEAFYEVKGLRTFLPLRLSDDWVNYLTCKVTVDLLPKLQYLRVLSLNGYRIMELPNSIGELKYIRYLDLSHTLIMKLPESVSTLSNLQTLILEDCSRLKVLPTNIRNLTNLRHLNNLDVPSLEGMPAKLGELTNMQTLSNFVVDKGSGSGIREIGPLHLQGTLCISRLENVNDVEDAKRANLICKEGLGALQLEWSGTVEKESDLLDMLEPHRKLKELSIKGYSGLKFSTWIGHPLYASLTLVSIENCHNCQFLPPLGQLPSLKKLYIKRISAVEIVGPEFYGDGSLPFPLLETLEFEDMQNWKDWFPCHLDQGIRLFPCLKMLSISFCPKLEGKIPENLDLLSKLVILGCEQLVVSVANYKQLCEVNIHDCKGVVHRNAVEFELLEVMVLSRISEFRLQKEGFVRGLTKLKDLIIDDCEELTSLWQNKHILLQQLISLRGLVIRGSFHSHFVQELTSLQELHIDGCQSLVSFPETGLPPSLKQIKIECCSSLKYFARYQIPPRLRNIEIARCINLKSLVEEEAEGSSASSLVKEQASCLEYLIIFGCPSLTSLSFDGHLPRTLKHLGIMGCEQLKSIADSFDEDTCLEDIIIDGCSILKSLPEGVCQLANLKSLLIKDQRSLVSFPRGGLPRSALNLREIEIDCDKLQVVPRGLLHNLISLRILKIRYCDSFSSFLEESFPANLIELQIWNLKSYKPLLEWGLHRLTSLKELRISGRDPNVVSFPPEEEMMLPKSLIQLKIEGFPNLSKLSKGFQSLTSLEFLGVINCPKLVSIPEEGLPRSLTQLRIYYCPLLKERYKPSKGRYWPSIVHIPRIDIFPR